MPKIVVDLNSDRSNVGTLHIENDDGTVIAGPFPALGKADTLTAANEGNPSCDSKKLYGDTPLGDYLVTRLISSPNKHIEDFGAHGLLVLEPDSGDALDARRNGRAALLVHSGDTDSEGSLLPTNGSIRLYASDMQDLISIIKINPGIGPEGMITGLSLQVLEETFPFKLLSDNADDSDPPQLLTARTFLVKKGDTLSSISKRFYGSTSFVGRIVDANRDSITDPNRIFPGQLFILPDVPYPIVYSVKKGDTLSKIAHRFYGDSTFFDLIFSANRDKISTPDVISVGQKIFIP